MKLGLLLTVLLFFTSPIPWETDISKAKERANNEQKIILLHFSGSDWCANCIKLKKELFETDTFAAFSKANLILVNADFPTKKKNKQSPTLKLNNEKLAQWYNPQGIFPLTILLDKNGKVLGQMKYPCNSKEEYIESINKKLKNE